MKNILGIILLMVLVGAVVLFLRIQKSNNSKIQEMKIGEGIIKYELAKTPKEIELGLSYRKDLPEGQGMLFVFPQKGMRTFWMHEMLFPLDMIWIANNTIVQIDENVPIKTNGAWTVVNANYPVDKVLEMKGGEVKRLGIENGAKAILGR